MKITYIYLFLFAQETNGMHPPWFRVIGWCLRFVTRWCLPQKAHKKVLDTHTVLPGLGINQVGRRVWGGSNTNFSSPPEVRGGEHKVGQQSDNSASVHCTLCTMCSAHTISASLCQRSLHQPAGVLYKYCWLVGEIERNHEQHKTVQATSDTPSPPSKCCVLYKFCAVVLHHHFHL